MHRHTCLRPLPGLVLLLVAFGGCNGLRDDRLVEPGVPLSDLVEAGLTRAPGQEGLPVLDRLDDPERIDVEPIENRHVPGQIDTLRTWIYDGLQFMVYDVSVSERVLMESIEVTSPDYATADGVRVGSSRSEVETRLGQPDERREDAYVYRLTEPAPNRLVVHFDQDEVSRLAWGFYIG
jgi:hypothetical protein